MMCYYFLFLILAKIIVICECDGKSFTDITDKVFTKSSFGYIAAYVDFNSDKKTDIIAISEDGTSVYLYTAQSESQFDAHRILRGNWSDGAKISSVTPADFDGDSLTDVLLTRSLTNGAVKAEVYWGREKSLLEKSTSLPEVLRDQPLVLDSNGDLIPDIFAETHDGQRVFVYFTSDRVIKVANLTNSSSAIPLPPLYRPQSSAFVDWDGDLTPDLVIVSTDADKRPQIEVWSFVDGTFEWKQTIPGPAVNSNHSGVMTFSDIDQTASVDAILPVCTDEDCLNKEIHIYNRSMWVKVPVKTLGSEAWGFAPVRPGQSWYLKLPISVRVGDLDLDGYPDLLTVLRHCFPNKTCEQKVVALMNVPCTTSQCDVFARSFTPLGGEPISTPEGDALIPSFFDTSENGKLDIFVTVYAKKPIMKAYRYAFELQSYFLKIMVIGGKCSKKFCLRNSESLAVDLPGPSSFYQTVKSNGHPQVGLGSQLSQSAYLALQLPYLIYGLGQAPNAVDRLIVGVQHTNVSSTDLNRTFTYVVPNTQMVIITSPQTRPDLWKTRMFMTHSHLVLLTAFALLGTFGIIIIIVAAFQWREHVMDKREKLQEAQKFHFDAM